MHRSQISELLVKCDIAFAAMIFFYIAEEIVYGKVVGNRMAQIF